jgi:hypothetical protein
MEKRLHTKGYHVNWKFNKNSSTRGQSENQNAAKVSLSESKDLLNSVELKQNSIDTNYSDTNYANDNALKRSGNKDSDYTTPKESVEREDVKISLNTVPKKSAVKTLWKDVKKGVKQTMKAQRKSNTSQETGQKTEGFAVAGFVTGIVGWFMPLGIGLLFCITAIVFAAISMNKIKANPDQYKGKGLAVAALVVGIVGCVIVLAVAAA